MKNISSAVFLITVFCSTCVFAAKVSSSTKQNQVWWTKKILKAEQQGCAAMCCTGRDSTCYSSGPRMGGKTAANGRCFCDEGCLDMNDCCEDYSVQCQAVDCEVGDWEDYGECSKPCGLGAKSRTRKVIQEPRNGGTECPALKESTVCIGTQCRNTRHLGSRGRVDRETARIMPAVYGQFRSYKNYNAHLDIRKNLHDRYYKSRTPTRRGYCATFEVMASRKNCLRGSAPWARVLNKGRQICVECQSKAMDSRSGMATTCVGHGSMEKDTFWTAVNAHGCHGWWRRKTELSECSCSDNAGLDFIFV